MKVYIDVDQWGFSSEEDKVHFFSRHTPKNRGIWNELTLVNSYHDSECVVCFDLNCKNHQANGKKVIQVKQEPILVQPYSRYPLANAYIDYQEDVHATFWFIDKPYDWLKNLTYTDALISKTKNCSAIFSNKHAYRNNFFSKLSNSTGEIDYFGRGIDSVINSALYKGPLSSNGLCKCDGLLPYQKSIAIENSSQSDYFTEKLVDCFMTWTLPIYFGCPNIGEKFPQESMRTIDLNDIESVLEKISAPVTKLEIEAIGESRRITMENFNFWSALERAIERI